MTPFRIGEGRDIHRLVPGRRLVLGGVTLDYPLGLEGHSDADALAHAIIDALLGAAALGDIGRLFPDTDPAYLDADSLILLGEAAKLVREAGYTIANIDSTVTAQRPYLAPFNGEMRRRLASAMEIETDRVSVKAKTNEGLDAAGRGEAIECRAAALIYKNVR